MPVFNGLALSALWYLDPGIGSLILQGLIAAAVAATFTIKIQWRRVKSLWHRMLGKAEEDTPSRHD
jgi:hypothetical protein